MMPKVKLMVAARYATRWVAVVAIGLISISSGYAREPAPTEDDAVKAYITDYNLLRANDTGTRIGFSFLHELYKAQPSLDPSIGARMADKCSEAWTYSYGPERNRDRDATSHDMDTVANTIADVASGKVGLSQVRDLLQVTYGAWKRENDAFERKLELMKCGDILKQSPAGWGASNAFIQRPEALLDAFAFASHNRQASQAMSFFSKRINNVGLDDPVSEWRRHNAAADQALKLTRIEGNLNKLVSSRQEVRDRLRELEDKVTTPARSHLKSREEKASAKPKEQLERELRDQFAPYFALNQLLMGLGAKDRDVQALGRVIDTGLKASMTSAGLASGALTGVEPVAGLTLTVFNMFQGAGPSDTQVILEAIRKVNENILALHRDMLQQFDSLKQHVKEQLYEMMSLISTRFDALEMHLRDQHRDLHQLLSENAFAIGLQDSKLNLIRSDIYWAVSEIRRELLRPLHAQLTWKEMDYLTFKTTMDKWWTSALGSARADFGPLPAGRQMTKHHPAFFREMHSVLTNSDDSWDRLNVLQEAGAVFGRALAERQLPNPKLWSICANNYLQLASKWPDYYRRYDEDLAKVSELLQAGRDLQQGTARVTRSWGRTASPDFLLELLAAYKDQVGHLDAYLGKRFLAYCGPDSRLKGYDPFLAMDQQRHPPLVINRDRPHRHLDAIDFQTIIPRHYPDPMIKIDPVPIDLSDEEQKAIEALIPGEFRAAEAMGLGLIRVGYTSGGIDDEWAIGDNRVYAHNGAASAEAIPEDIRKRFPTYIRFNINCPYSRVCIVLRADFRPAEGEPVPQPIFNLKATSDQYFQLVNRRPLVLLEKEPSNVQDKGLSFSDRFKEQFSVFKKQLVERKAVELDPVAAKRSQLAVGKQVEKALAEQKKDMLQAEKASFGQPGGDLRLLLNQVSGARALLLDFLRLGIGDWLATPAGKKLFETAVSLRTGDELASEIAGHVDRYLDPQMRAATLNLATSTADQVSELINAALNQHPLVVTPGTLQVLGPTSVGLMGSPLGQGPILATSALVPGRTTAGSPDPETRRSSPASSIGHHALVEETVARLDAFLDQELNKQPVAIAGSMPTAGPSGWLLGLIATTSVLAVTVFVLWWRGARFKRSC